MIKKNQQIYIINKSEVPQLNVSTNGTFFNGEKITKSKIKEICQNSLKNKSLSSLYNIKLIAALALRRKQELIPEQIELKIDNDGRSKYNCFYVKMVDKNWEDFSFNKALRLDQSFQHKEDIKEAFRYSILDQIISFRTQQLSDSLINSIAGMHVDHIIPFVEILHNFCQEYNLKLEDVEIKHIGESKRTIVDKKIKEDWQKYHDKHAKLRLITSHENLTRSRKKMYY